MPPAEFDIKKLLEAIELFILETEKNIKPSCTAARPYIDDLKKIILKHLIGKAS